MLTFKSQADKDAAMDNINVDPPPGVNVEEFLADVNQKMQEIDNAEIIGDTPQETPPETTQPPQETQDNQITPPPANQESEMLQRNNEYLQHQLQTQRRENDDRIKALEDKIDQMKNQSQQIPQKREQKTEVDHQIISVQSQIDQLEKEMNIDTDDFDTEEILKKQVKSNKLLFKLNSLKEQKMQDLFKKQNAEIETLKNNQRLERKNTEQETAYTEKSRLIEKFRNENPEFKSKKTYSEMDNEYSNFAPEVAAIYFNRPVSQIRDEDMEVAMQKYLEGSPILNNALQQRGIQEPDSLK
jgi:hypothetical protein